MMILYLAKFWTFLHRRRYPTSIHPNLTREKTEGYDIWNKRRQTVTGFRHEKREDADIYYSSIARCEIY